MPSNSMKRVHNVIGFALLAGLAAIANPAAVAETFKVAVVDVEAVVKGYDRYLAEMIAMKESFQPQVEKLTAEQEAWTKRRTDALERKPPLDPIAAEEVRGDLAADYEKLEGRRALLAQEVQRAESVIQTDLMNDLNAEIGRFAHEKELNLVLRIDHDSVLYSDDSLNITPKLIDRLNDSYKKQN